MLSPYKVIFFDAGGTLFHPYPSVGEIYQRVAIRYGCRAEAGDLQRMFHDAWVKRDGLSHSRMSLGGNPEPGSSTKAFEDDPKNITEKIEKEWWRGLVHEVFSCTGGVERFEEFFEELYDAFAAPEVWRLYPGAQDLLEALKKERKRLAIISNWDSRLFKLCEGLGLNAYFDFILASAVFGASKPNPLIFQEALKRMGVQSHEAVHIGDSYEDDVKGALAVGMNAILIDRVYPPRQFKTIKTIKDLKEFFP